MATLRNKRKLAAVTRETTRNNQSQNTLNTGMAEEYMTHFSEEIEGRVTKKLPQEFNWTESRILGALCKLDELLLNPQVRTSSVAVPGTSRNNNSEKWEPSWDRSLDDPCPELMFSACYSEQEETHHSYMWQYFSRMRLK